MTVQKKCIETLNTDIEFSKILKIDCTGSKKAVKFGNFPKSIVFRMSIEHFLTFLKINSIFEFSVPIRVF